MLCCSSSLLEVLRGCSKSRSSRVLGVGEIMSFRVRRQAFEHQVNHADLHHGFAGDGEFFTILAQPATPRQPCNRSFYHPTLGQDLESMLVLGTPDNLNSVVNV